MSEKARYKTAIHREFFELRDNVKPRLVREERQLAALIGVWPWFIILSWVAHFFGPELVTWTVVAGVASVLGVLVLLIRVQDYRVHKALFNLARLEELMLQQQSDVD